MGIGTHGSGGEDTRGPRVAAAKAAVAASAVGATSSLEKTLDEATERYCLSHDVQRELRQLEGGAGAAALAMSAPHAGALAVAPRRLRWRGREVSDEFQRYAERVATGEELAPYRGQVLARPCVDSPWGVPAPPPPRPAPRVVVVGALLAASVWLLATLLVAPRAPVSSELDLQPSTPVYATRGAPSQLGALSSRDVEPLAQRGSGELSQQGAHAPALSDDRVVKTSTRPVSEGRRRALGSGPVAVTEPPVDAQPTVDGEPPTVPEATAPPTSDAVEDFDWLLDGADGADGAEGPEGPEGAAVSQNAVMPPVVPEASPRPGTGGPASAGQPTPARNRSPLLLETAPF